MDHCAPTGLGSRTRRSCYREHDTGGITGWRPIHRIVRAGSGLTELDVLHSPRRSPEAEETDTDSAILDACEATLKAAALEDDIFWHRKWPLQCGRRRLQKVTNSHQQLGNLCILSVRASPRPGPRTRQTGPELISKKFPLLGSPLRNRTVDLLLTMATPHRPGRTACTNGTLQCPGSTACTQCARHPVHDSFHDQHAASGPHITLSDGVQGTKLRDGAVISFRSRNIGGLASSPRLSGS